MNPPLDDGEPDGIDDVVENGCGMDPEAQSLVAHCLRDSRETPRFALIGDSKAYTLIGGVIRTSQPGGRWLMIGGTNENGAPVPMLIDHPAYEWYPPSITAEIDAVNRDIDNCEITRSAFDTHTSDYRTMLDEIASEHAGTVTVFDPYDVYFDDFGVAYHVTNGQTMCSFTDHPSDAAAEVISSELITLSFAQRGVNTTAEEQNRNRQCEYPDIFWGSSGIFHQRYGRFY